MKAALLFWTTIVVIWAESCNFVVSLDQESDSQDEQNFLGQEQPLDKTGESIGRLCVDRQGRKLIGTFRVKWDCRKFVQCGYGLETVSDCPPGLLFNRVTTSCDWPLNANCIEFRAKNAAKLVIPESEIPW